jgi:hypothetical protein
MDDDFIKEVVEYKERRLGIIFLFLALMIIPFTFALINFLSLKTCESNESNSCPSMFLPPPASNNCNGSSAEYSVDYATTKNVVTCN